MKRTVKNSINYYESDSDSDYDLDDYHEGKSELFDLFKSENSNISELNQEGCVYLSLNIYNNTMTNHYFEDEEGSFYLNKINLLEEQIVDSKLAFCLKVGATDSTVYKRLCDEFRDKDSLLYCIPIAIMTGNNVRKIETELHKILDDIRLKIMIKKKTTFWNPKELYEIRDEYKESILNYLEEKDLECIYDINLQKGETWFDIIPIEVQNILTMMMPDKELELLDVDDNLFPNQLQFLREKSFIKSK